MRIAAIDIGSNAIRLQISAVVDWENATLKKMEYIRFPLRLGKDVFETGEITPPTEERFVKLMIAFKQFLELYEVQDYMVCATSAMREAHNGKLIAKRVYYAHGVQIQIIDGALEGEIITNAVEKYIENGLYLHIDVGGGSTELSIIQNKERVAVKSFRMGSVRQLDEEKKERVYEKINDFLTKNLPIQREYFKAVGTGGNIKKMYELVSPGNRKAVLLKELQKTREIILAHTYEERISKLNMNADRADVIVPASEIYLKVMEMAQVNQMIVPDVGLKDGILQTLFKKHAELRM
ncbi:MAG: exopolyphosphatase/guanosine-5'-triphosphate,3'-diphosphate pyrophosphatase [Flammeovirgaceae bacterium]|jgi:exopolyphosphatase/guanosine-5'-triphosphate,3'-diphosphate pyrophosphatase